MAIKQMTKGRIIGLVAAKQPKPEVEKPTEKNTESEQRSAKRK